jgi:hypothetical protein
MILLRLQSARVSWPDGRPDNPLTRAWNVLDRRIEGLPDDERRALIPFIREHCQLVRIETNDVDEAFRVFDSQRTFRGLMSLSSSGLG